MKPQYPRPSLHRFLGFTLIEVLIVVAILAILAALAGPSFGHLMRRWQVRTTTQEFVASLQLARMEALRQGGEVQISRLPIDGSGPTACNAGVIDEANFSCGWQIIANGQVIQTVTKNSNQVMLINRDSNQALSINFDRFGQANGLGAAGLDFFTHLGVQDSVNASRICVSSGGRIQLVKWEDAPNSGC